MVISAQGAALLLEQVLDRVTLGRAQFEVLEVQGNRIRSLSLELPAGDVPAAP